MDGCLLSVNTLKSQNGSYRFGRRCGRPLICHCDELSFNLALCWFLEQNVRVKSCPSICNYARRVRLQRYNVCEPPK